MDETTDYAMRETASSVIVLSLIEIGVALKTILWGVGYTDRIHENDLSSDDFLAIGEDDIESSSAHSDLGDARSAASSLP